MLQDLNFCSSCGADVVFSNSRARLKARFIGIKCSVCQRNLSANQLKQCLIGITFGFLCGFSIFIFKLSSPQNLQAPTLSTLVFQEKLSLTDDNTKVSPADEKSKVSINEQFHLCGATTKSGKPCKRKVQGNSGVCWQHKEK